MGRVSSRAVSGWSRSPGYCGFRGVFWAGRDFFVCFRHLLFQIHARVHERWLRETQSSQRRLGEEATTVSQSAHRELAPTDPHLVYHLHCPYLRVMASVDKKSSFQPQMVRPSRFPASNDFHALTAPVAQLLARQSTPADIRKRDIEACNLTRSIPAGRCV